MIIKEGTKIGMVANIINKCNCNIYSKVRSFNTETCEAEIYVTLKEVQPLHPLFGELVKRYNPDFHSGDSIARFNQELVTARVHLPFAIAVNKHTGEELKFNNE